MKSLNVILLLLLLSAPAPAVLGQACCSAGTPLLNALELPATETGSLQFALTYDRNILGDVVSGSTDFVDDSRSRITQNLLLETSYGFQEHFSISALLTFVNHERNIRSPVTGGQNVVGTNGIGDAVILVKRSLVRANLLEQREVAIGLGGKIPLGKSDLAVNGILLPADLQPGTGAFDAIFWGYASEGFGPSLPLNLFTSLSYRLTGSNDRYGPQNNGYRFGNEFIASLGAVFRTDLFFDISLIALFRHSRADTFGGDVIPNTGGRWLSILPGININATGNLTVRVSAQLPVYRNLQGTQLTTSYTTALTVFYTITKLTTS